MTILSFITSTPGQVNNNPRKCYLLSTDSLATITTAGYLNKSGEVLQGNYVFNTDIIETIYSYSASTFSGSYTRLIPSIAPTGIITLNVWENPSGIQGAVTSGDFAVFNTNGSVKDLGYKPSSAIQTNIAICNSPSSGNINQVFYISNTNGVLSPYNSLGGAVPVYYNTIALTTQTIPDASRNYIFIPSINLTAAGLASAGKINVQLSSAAKQYLFKRLSVNYSASGLSGGSGDRDVNITDGTNTFATIPASLLGTPVNTLYGSLNFSGTSFLFNTMSVAGTNIYAQYSGGTLDYTAGTVNISLEFIRST